MNARFTALFVAITLLVPSIGQAGEAVGTAKARGDYGNFQSQGSVTRSAGRSRPTYRYSAPVVREALARRSAKRPRRAVASLKGLPQRSAPIRPRSPARIPCR